jgi:small-conductance mechanosensitive channel
VYELAKRTLLFVAFVIGIYAASLILKLPIGVQRGLTSIFVIAVFIQGALWADQLLASITEWQLARQHSAAAAARNALAIIRFLSRVAVWAVALLLIFSNLGFDVTALVAGLGIGGIAIALAAQNVLADLFASIAIVLDRPFGVGDFITFGDERGTVERIGIKTTRIRSLSGEQISCPNTDLLNARVHNFKRMSERRVEFSIGTTYDTPYESLERIPTLLKTIVKNQEKVRFERAHFQGYGNSALTFEVVYWVLSADSNVYMDIQQAINLAVFRTFEEEGIKLAHPSSTFHVEGLKELLAATGDDSAIPLRRVAGRR